MDETLDAVGILFTLDSISLPPILRKKIQGVNSPIIKGTSRSQCKKDFGNTCDTFFRTILQHFGQTPRWSDLFHTRMIQLQSTTPYNQVKVWIEAFHYYVHS